MYQGVRVPVAFYKVVAVIDDAKGQLSVTAFEMDQSNVMPPQPGAPMPGAPFDPGRFSVDQMTLSELEEFGPRFREAEGFPCIGGAATVKVPVKRRPAAPTLDGVREAVLWAP